MIATSMVMTENLILKQKYKTLTYDLLSNTKRLKPAPTLFFGIFNI